MSRPISSSHARNLNATGQNLSAGIVGVSKIVAYNTSAAVAFVQLFDLAATNVTLGTTRPLVVIVLAATTGFQVMDFAEAIVFGTQLSVFSTTTVEGAVGSADGVFMQVFVA